MKISDTLLFEWDLPLFYQPLPFHGKNLNTTYLGKFWKLKSPLYKMGFPTMNQWIKKTLVISSMLFHIKEKGDLFSQWSSFSPSLLFQFPIRNHLQILLLVLSEFGGINFFYSPWNHVFLMISGEIVSLFLLHFHLCNIKF